MTLGKSFSLWGPFTCLDLVSCPPHRFVVILDVLSWESVQGNGRHAPGSEQVPW